MKPMPAKPRIIIAHVEGSGTAEAPKEKLSKNTLFSKPGASEAPVIVKLRIPSPERSERETESLNLNHEL
jgi:hypothetical protein